MLPDSIFDLDKNQANAVADLALSVGFLPNKVLEKLEQEGRITLLELYTFGFIRTPIGIETEEAFVVNGHVTYWPGRRITITRVEGDYAVLVGAEDIGSPPDSDQALEIYLRYCLEDETETQ